MSSSAGRLSTRSLEKERLTQRDVRRLHQILAIDSNDWQDLGAGAERLRKFRRQSRRHEMSGNQRAAQTIDNHQTSALNIPPGINEQ
jgi:hypothetical protein